MSTIEDAGRQEYTATYFTAQQRLILKLLGAVVVTIGAWWLASAVTGEAGWSLAEAQLAASRALRGHLPGPLTIVVFAALMTAFTVAAVTFAVRRGKRRRAAVGMSDVEEVRRIAGEQRARDIARYTRKASVAAGLDVDKCPVNEIGWQVGHAVAAPREPVILDLQNQIGVFGPTGAGKTRYLMANAVADAPGALVITTTKLMDYAHLIEGRERLGRVMVWDPLNPTAGGMFWNPVKGAHDSAVASARGVAFTADSNADQSDAGKFFGDACGLIFTRLLMAAAVSGGTMRDVRSWSTRLQSSGIAAISILRSGYPKQRDWAETLAKLIEGEGKTVENVQMTLALKVEPLMNEAVMEHLEPSPDREEFDPAEFVRSRDTLIIVTDDNARTNVSSLATMLLNEITDAAKALSASLRRAMDPPLTIVGDEIANVAPLPKLPSMLSDSRGIGIRWIIAVQSLAQLVARWGDHEGKKILANLNVSLVLGGLQDTEALERFSSLAGKADVTEASVTAGANGRAIASTQWSARERDVFRPEEIAHLPEGRAFMQVRSGRSLLVELTAYDKR